MVLVTVARFCVLTLTLCQTKVYQHPLLRRGIIEEVCGFDIAVYDVVGVDCGKGSEQGAEVDGHVRDGHVAEVVAEVMMAEIGEDGDNLVGRAEGGDQGTDSRAVAEVIKELEFVEDAGGRGRDVNLLDCDKLLLSSRLSLRGLGGLLEGGRR